MNLTGKASLNIEDISSSNKMLKGNMKVVLENNEFIPASTQVLINNSGEEFFYSLSDLVKNKISQGSYYVSGKNISGSGEGYGASSNSVSFV